MQGKYDEIAAILIPYCDEHLNDEYKDLCLHALEKLCRKRPSPVASGRAKTWAAGIIYAIGQNNFIFDKSQAIHMTAVELVEPLGIAKTTASSKAAEIKKLLKIDHFNSEWVLASDMESNPMLWLVEINGLPERGLIPYVPGHKDRQDK